MADADRYHRLQLWLGLLAFGISLAYLVTLLLTGAGHAVAVWAARITPAAWAQVALVALALGLAHGALGMPVTLARGVWLPRRVGPLHPPLRAWARPPAPLRLRLPLARGFWLPRRFGLPPQPLRAWLADRLKALLIGG